ncbi:hypothetical protein PWT90_03436 [Aphanocladium album]|nr:hypothetical protein PWT90_03436 [Aphanocladium album]
MSIFGSPPGGMLDAIQVQLEEEWPSKFGHLGAAALWSKHNTVTIDLQDCAEFWADTFGVLRESSSVEDFEAKMLSFKNRKQEELCASLKASGGKVSISPEAGLPLSSPAGRAVHRAANSGSLSSLTNIVRGTAHGWKIVEAEVCKADAAVTQNHRHKDGSSPELPFTQVDPSNAFLRSTDSLGDESDESDDSESGNGSVRQIKELSAELPPDIEQSWTGDGLAGVVSDGTAGSHDIPTIHDGVVSAPGQATSCPIGEQTVFTQGGGVDVGSQARGTEKKNSPGTTCNTSRFIPGGCQLNSAVQATPSSDSTLSPKAEPRGRRKRLSDPDDTESICDSHTTKKARM